MPVMVIAMMIMPAVGMRRFMVPWAMVRMMMIGRMMIFDNASAEHQAQGNQGDVKG
ncbi:Uncharacterised protein [Enterobacter hormaechei]|nr:hypothetical protein [Enterobacter hormaechei subsp. steigerwaltii]CZX54252.1 Uncharacterised protein [Enterobacter hormaechei]